MKKDDIGMEMIGQLRRAWRHRSGISILGKTVIEDNRIPGIILDTFDNLGMETKDKRKPVIIKKLKTDYGWYLIINLPPGISFSQVKKRTNWFADAIKGFVIINWINGSVHMEVQTNSLPEKIPFKWDSSQHENMELPIPIGFSQKGLEVFDLTEAPHMLIGGQTGWGKTTAMHCIANSLLDKAQVCIGDPKRIDFRYLKKKVILARDDEEIETLLKKVNKESDRRLRIIEKEDPCITKIQELDNPPPYIVVFIDEMAQLSKNAMDLLWRVGSLSRAAGIHVIAATQYPYREIIPTTLRNLFEARLCFRVASEASSRVILGEEGSMAAWLPPVKGRAIWKFGVDFKEVQTMLLSKEQRQQITQSLDVRGWELEPSCKRLNPR